MEQLWKEETFVRTISEQVTKVILDILTKTMSTHEQKIIDVHNEVKTIESKVNEQQANLTMKLVKLENEFQKFEKKYDIIDQYSRRRNLRIFKLEEKPNENSKHHLISIIRDRMKVVLEPEDIEACYRVGKKRRKSQEVYC